MGGCDRNGSWGDWLWGVEWIQLAHVKDLVSAMMKLRVRYAVFSSHLSI
jgi:hypothetical protein